MFTKQKIEKIINGPCRRCEMVGTYGISGDDNLNNLKDYLIPKLTDGYELKDIVELAGKFKLAEESYLQIKCMNCRNLIPMYIVNNFTEIVDNFIENLKNYKGDNLKSDIDNDKIQTHPGCLYGKGDNEMDSIYDKNDKSLGSSNGTMRKPDTCEHKYLTIKEFPNNYLPPVHPCAIKKIVECTKCKDRLELWSYVK